MSKSSRILAWVFILALCGCASQRAFDEGKELVEAGDLEAGLQKLEAVVRDNPERKDFRLYYVRQKELASQRLVIQAETARQRNEATEARTLFERAALIDPSNQRATQGLEALKSDDRHKALLKEAEGAYKAGKTAEAQAKLQAILAEDPSYKDAQELRRKIEEKRANAGTEQALSAALRRPITLEFRDTDLKTILELVSRTTGVNFFFDKDVRPDLKTTVFVRNTSIDDVLRFILVTNQLERKVLNENTLLIYPNTAAKVKEYQELVTKSFYLAHADVKQTANMIKNLVKTKDVFTDEKLKLVIMRDTPNAIRMAEKLVAAQDLAESEVMLEVEVMEVASNLITELGVRYPSQVTASIVGSSGTGGTFTLNEWHKRSAGLYRISVTNPALILNLKDQLSRANTLANPRIRVRDGQKAKIHIGDRVPVITTTLTATSFVSESVSYLDVGLKLDVEPTISLANEVSLKMGLEVSNIVREIRSASGTLTYQLGTRNANTALHLKDGETQILAGLISDDERKIADRVPGLGSLPVVGRLFSSHNDTASKTEIVLLITPHILRTVARPDVNVTEFLSGTESSVGAPPLVLRSADAVAALSGKAPGAAVPSAQRDQAAPTPAVPSTATRFVLQTPAQARVGDEFTISVDLRPEQPIHGGNFELAFDQSRLKVVAVEEGELLKRAGKDTNFKYSIQDKAGRVSASFGAGSALKEPGNVARITFQVRGATAGTTLLTIGTPTAIDASGKTVALAATVPATLMLSR